MNLDYWRISTFTIITSLIFFTLTTLLFNIFSRKNKLFYVLSIDSIILIFFLTFLRMFFIYELRGSFIIKDQIFLTRILNVLKYEIVFLGFSIQWLLVILWVTGFIVSLLREINRWQKLKNKLKRITTIEDQELIEKVEKNKLKLNIKYDIDVIRGTNILEPFSLFTFHSKKMYIPNLDFTQKDYENIITHELNHFKNRDGVKCIIMLFIKCMLWWNPASLIFVRNFKQIVEIKCDVETTSNYSEEEKLNYLQTLIKIIKISKEDNLYNDNLLLYICGSKSVQETRQRFKIILNNSEKELLKKKLLSIIIIVLLFISSLFIVIQPHYEFNLEEGTYTVETPETDFIIYDKHNKIYSIYLEYEKVDILSEEELINNEKYEHLNIYNSED